MKHATISIRYEKILRKFMNNCFKCGNVLDNNYRCCMNCGAINLNHPDNKNIVEVLKANGTIKELKTINNIDKVNENNAMNIVLFIILNCIGFLALIIGISTKTSDLTYNLILSSIIYFYFICYQLLLKKANLPWWGIFIPIYNLYLINKLSFGNGWYCIIPFVPIILFLLCVFLHLLNLLSLVMTLSHVIFYIYPILLLFCIGRRFGRSGILTLLLSFIIIPSIALSNRYQYEY